MTTSNIQTFYNKENPNRLVRIIMGYTDDQKGKDILDGQAMVNGPRKAHTILETGKRRARADAQPTEPAASATRGDLLERSAFALMGSIKSSFIEDASSTSSILPNYLRKNSKSPRLIACKTGS
jgi:hypothetical protein